MGKCMAFSWQLTMQVTPELWALLKVVPKAHAELQAMLINVQQYKPTWAIGGTSTMPEELDFPSSTRKSEMSRTTRLTWTICTVLILP